MVGLTYNAVTARGTVNNMPEVAYISEVRIERVKGDRAYGLHADNCPVYRSLRAAIDISPIPLAPCLQHKDLTKNRSGTDYAIPLATLL